MSNSVLKRMAGGGRHTVIVKLPFEDENGAVTTGELRVVYRGVSLREGAEIEARAELEKDSRKALVNVLADVVLAIVDGDQSLVPDAEFFSTLDTFYLNRINAAIQQDRAGGPND